MRNVPRPPSLAAAIPRVLLDCAAATALVLLGASGVRLGQEQATGLLDRYLAELGHPSWAWCTHRNAAAALILAAIAYLVFTRPWRWPLPDAQAMLAFLRGGRAAMAEIRARLWVAIMAVVGLVILSGSLLLSAPSAVLEALASLHLAAGIVLLALVAGYAVVSIAALRLPGESDAAQPEPADEPAVPVRRSRRWRRLRARDRLASLTLYLSGCLLFSLGVKLFIDSALGTDPLSSMAIGVAGLIWVPWIGVGLVSSAATLVMLGLWWLWTRRRPPLSTFLTMALAGYAVDVWNALGLELWTGAALSPIGQMLAGLFLDAYASALIIMSGFGIRVVDLLALAMVGRWRLRFFEAKLLIEGTFFAVALLTGGPLGIATVAFVAIVAPFIEPFVLMNRYVLHLPYLGPGGIAEAS